MNISEVFSTPQRVTLLKYVMFKTGGINVSEVSKYTNISKGLVSKYLNLLIEEDILEKEGQTFKVKNSPNTKAVKILLSLTSIDTDILRDSPIIESGGIYGSSVKGTNTEESDVDLWLLHKPASAIELSKITRQLTSQANIKPLYLTTEKLEHLKSNDPVFYYNLLFSSITLYGEGLDAI